eukprot:TRINITY_DN56153_c0_g1_i1.p1 TRINITY_DN56153_c0_g1~~TRINITY_DN56153_c0_g1_i1.p1  ORF type:complete len:259 (+),score=43.12 TRINITY_DN56153_c0_g1_i1:90-866(+)
MALHRFRHLSSKAQPPSLRLVYLPFRAMAETTRFMLRHGGVPYEDEVIWGGVFAERRARGDFPFDKVPVMLIDGTTIAQSGTLARYAAKLADCYPADPAECAFNDAIFEMAQELCTINPMINCYVGRQYEQVKNWYFASLPSHVHNLEAQFRCVQEKRGGEFFGGTTASYADFNVYHHFANARLVEPQCIPDNYKLSKWMERMEELPAMKDYLAERPELVGIGENPGLLDKNGRFLSQRDPEGRALLVQGRFEFETAE